MSQLFRTAGPFGVIVAFERLFFVELIIKLLHPIRRFLPHLLRHMAIDIQRELGRCVAQVGLDGLNVISGIEGGDGEGVSQVVESGFLHTGTLGHFLEMLHYGAPNQVLSEGIGKHQIPGILKARSGVIFRRLLLFLLLAQGIHDHRCRQNGAALAVLWCLQEILTVLALKLLFDGDNAGLKVYIIPTKPKQLSLPHAREKGCDEEVAVLGILPYA